MVILSVLYWALRRVLELVLLRLRSERCKELRSCFFATNSTS